MDVPTDSSEAKFIQKYVMKNQEVDFLSSHDEEKKLSEIS